MNAKSVAIFCKCFSSVSYKIPLRDYKIWMFIQICKLEINVTDLPHKPEGNRLKKSRNKRQIT